MCILKETVTHHSQNYVINILLDFSTDSQYVSAAFIWRAKLDINITYNNVWWIKVINEAFSQISEEVSFTLFMKQYCSQITA